MTGPRGNPAARLRSAVAAILVVGGRKAAAMPSGAGIAGCRARTASGGRRETESCRGEVVWTGLLFVPTSRAQPAQVWQAFACAEHGSALVAARRLRPNDTAVLARWAEHAQRPATDPARADDPPCPLAEGAVAHEVIQRARHWSTRHLDG
jgi:hypothetical protein